MTSIIHKAAYLYSNTGDNNDQYNPQCWIRQLTSPSQRLFDTDSEALAAHDRQRADGAGDGDIDQWVCVTPASACVEYQPDCTNCYQNHVSDESCTETHAICKEFGGCFHV